MALNKEQVTAAIRERAASVEEVHVPEWGGSVFIRRLTADQMEKTGIMDGKTGGDLPVAVVAACLANEDGSQMFTLKEARVLGESDAEVIVKLFAECAKRNGLLSPELEEAVAAFATAQPDASSSS